MWTCGLFGEMWSDLEQLPGWHGPLKDPGEGSKDVLLTQTGWECFPQSSWDKSSLASLSTPKGVAQYVEHCCLLSEAHLICKHVVTSRPLLPLCALVSYFQALGTESALWHKSLLLLSCVCVGGQVGPLWLMALMTQSWRWSSPFEASWYSSHFHLGLPDSFGFLT